jgi:hypothetical protein
MNPELFRRQSLKRDPGRTARLEEENEEKV